MTAAVKMRKAREARDRKRRERQREVRRELRAVTPRYRTATRRYQKALSLYGEGSPEERRAFQRLLPIEGEWCRLALVADKVGVAL